MPKTEAPGGIGPAGTPAVVIPSTYYKGYLVDKTILDNDPHFANGCSSCHRGNGKSADQEKAHEGIVRKPSADLQICSDCHEDITKAYQYALHYTVQGMFNKVSRRFSKKEEKIFADKVFQQSCRSCHASCGDCHVRSPSRDGISTGLVSGHRFVKKNEGMTCGVCHGGRVYPEYTGMYSGSPDVHYQKGMTCTACHKKSRLHGTGNTGANQSGLQNRPKCKDCHKTGGEAKTTARLAHTKHEGRVSCYGCHTQGDYRSCYNCHKGKASSSGLSFILGADPADKKVLTTLRAIPVARDTFLDSGIKMENFNDAADYRPAFVHNIRKSTERTRSCDVCHVKRKSFLSKGSLIRNGSGANEGLIFKMGAPSID